MILGRPEADVAAFVSWMTADCAERRRCFLWDFEKAPGIEGVDILQELANKLPDPSQFRSELLAIDMEFNRTPRPVVSQVVGERATAGHDQTIYASITTPTLTSYRIENLVRLACAFFRDLETASQGEPILLLISGIRVGCDEPVPSKKLLDVLMSSVWRLAESCAPERICVSIAATSGDPAELRSAGSHFVCQLGLIAQDDAVEAMIEVIADLPRPEAKAVVDSVADEGTRRVSYVELQRHITKLKANRIEPSAKGAGQ
jgi:hypothetical protein